MTHRGPLPWARGGLSKTKINFRETFATLNTALKSMKWFWVTLLFIREFNKINISLNSIFFKPWGGKVEIVCILILSISHFLVGNF